jgi:hypothetical protein
MFVLKEWSVVFTPPDRFTPPEMCPTRLFGKVYGNPKFEDGKRVTTSRIVGVDGREITTKSGSVYLLDGPPYEEYMEFLKNNNMEYNDEAPIKGKKPDG